jgi:N-acetylglucosaminyldiphosphoundecaprenol N-acetyl-beta-D-mannosaminyltransferase
MTHFRIIKILGINICNVTYEETIDFILKGIKNNIRPISIYTPNVDFLVKAIKNKDFKTILNNADLLVPDGKPLIWASRYQGNPLKGKIAGSTLFFKICKLAPTHQLKIFLLGSLEGVAIKAKSELEKDYPGITITGVYSPKYGFEKDPAEVKNILEILKASNSDILFVGLGAPKQEIFIANYKATYEIPVSIGIGASIDFAAKIKRMPPQWIKDMGFGWLWRLAEEPSRLWKRYLIDDMKFFYYVFLETKKLRDYNTELNNRLSK